jgi:MoxR-like ATPase
MRYGDGISCGWTIEAEEVRIIRRVPQISERLAREISGFMRALRPRRLYKTPGVAETLDWSRALVTLHQEHLDVAVVETLRSARIITTFVPRPTAWEVLRQRFSQVAS